VPRGKTEPNLLNPRRDAILDAALEVFAEEGVAAASIERIRELSRASTGSIYHHFGSKEGIAGALYVACLADYQREFLHAVESQDRARDFIEAGVRQHLAWVAANRERAIFLTTAREALTLADLAELRELNSRFFGRLKQLFAPWIEAGRLRNLPLNLLEAIWIGPSQEITRHWLAGRVETLEGAADTLATAAWNALMTHNKEIR
jgi:AcrR family transcriptional regulator